MANKTLDVQHIRYIKPDETEASDRHIVTAEKPSGNLLALDVTELSEAERLKMADAYSAYVTAFEAHKKTFPKFETFLTDAQIDLPVKWRSFASNRIMPATE